MLVGVVVLLLFWLIDLWFWFMLLGLLLCVWLGFDTTFEYGGFGVL